MGIANIKAFLTSDNYEIHEEMLNVKVVPKLDDVIEDIYSSGKRVIFTMGKGGVGKTTIAAAVALGLAQKRVKVHLTTTDPAAHLRMVVSEATNMR